jgi:hypothetical protein
MERIKFDDIAIEPSYLSGYYFGIGEHELPIELGGIKPDILLRLRNLEINSCRYIIIENKMKDKDAFTSVQRDNYVKLVEFLPKRNIQCEYLVLTSCGCNKIFTEIDKFQEKLQNKF